MKITAHGFVAHQGAYLLDDDEMDEDLDGDSASSNEEEQIQQ